jgi:hypothetical protein
MTEPRTTFEGEWADSSGKAVIDIGPFQTASGLRVSICAEGGWPGLHDAEMHLTPREAVELADALLTFAAPGAPDVVQAFGAGFGAPPPVQDPNVRGLGDPASPQLMPIPAGNATVPVCLP